MTYRADLKELTNFLLDKFNHPNFDHRTFGGPSDAVQAERDFRFTLNDIQDETDDARCLELLTKLEGQTLILQTVSYYSEKEVQDILNKIDSLKKELQNGKDF